MRRWRIHPILLNREEQGTYHRLVQELQLNAGKFLRGILLEDLSHVVWDVFPNYMDLSCHVPHTGTISNKYLLLVTCHRFWRHFLDFPIRLGIRNGKNHYMERSKYAVPVYMWTPSLISIWRDFCRMPYACERSLPRKSCLHVKM